MSGSRDEIQLRRLIDVGRGLLSQEQSTRRLETARTIAVAVGAEMELDQVLELIAKRGRALVDARSLVILLRAGAARRALRQIGSCVGADVTDAHLEGFL